MSDDLRDVIGRILPAPENHLDAARMEEARKARRSFMGKALAMGAGAVAAAGAARPAWAEGEDAILKIPEVISCHYISGAGTFELQVVSKDLNSFSQFARDVLINLPNVKDLHTSFSLGEVKAVGALPLKA